MENAMQTHQRLTRIRARAYAELFGDSPSAFFPYHHFSDTDTPFIIDVFVYPLAVKDLDGSAFVVVTNGMSNTRMVDAERPDLTPRRELIQYVPVGKKNYAQRLHNAAWLPHVERFAVDIHDTIRFEEPVERDFKHALFLAPIWSRHANFEVDLESEHMSLLWHIPLTDQELSYKEDKGVDALLDRMDRAKFPWLFDPAHRPSLLASPIE